MSVEATLSHRLLAATTFCVGSDEQAINKILKTAHDQNLVPQLEEEIKIELRKNGLLWLYKSKGSVLQSILDRNLSGSEFKRAEDYLHYGRDTYRGTKKEFFLEGLQSTYDLSGTRELFFTIAGIGVCAGLTALAAPLGGIAGAVAGLVGGGLLFANTTVSVVQFISNYNKYNKGTSLVNQKLALREMGAATSSFLTSVPFIPQGLRSAKSGLNYLRMRNQKIRAMASLLADKPDTVRNKASIIKRVKMRIKVTKDLHHVIRQGKEGNPLAIEALIRNAVRRTARATAPDIIATHEQKINLVRSLDALLEVVSHRLSKATLWDKERLMTFLRTHLRKPIKPSMNHSDMDRFVANLHDVVRSVHQANRIPVSRPQKMELLEAVYRGFDPLQYSVSGSIQFNPRRYIATSEPMDALAEIEILLKDCMTNWDATEKAHGIVLKLFSGDPLLLPGDFHVVRDVRHILSMAPEAWNEDQIIAFAKVVRHANSLFEEHVYVKLVQFQKTGQTSFQDWVRELLSYMKSDSKNNGYRIVSPTSDEKITIFKDLNTLIQLAGLPPLSGF